MAAVARRIRPETNNVQEALNRVLTKESDPEGISSDEESKLDRELENESDKLWLSKQFCTKAV